MSRISFSSRPLYSPVKMQGVSSKSAKIEAIRMEIANIQQKADYGFISQEDARSQIAALEAQIQEIEYGIDTSVSAASQDMDIAHIDNSVEVNSGADTGSDAGGSDDDFDNNKENSADTYLAQQALYNRVIHNL